MADAQRMAQAPTSLTTARLHLRQLAAADADAMHTLSLEPAVRRYLWRDRVIPPERAMAFIASSAATFDQDGFGIFAVFPDTEAGRAGPMIGFSGLQRFEDGEQVELRFAVHPAHWGAGLATEAMLAVLQDAFQRNVLDTVIAHTGTPDQRSVRTLQRLGMSFDRRGRFHGLDTMFYSTTREDFEEYHDLA